MENNNDNKQTILAESPHYFIRKEYERAMLYRKPDAAPVACVGDFYGDPADAYIDPEERFCITVGCGIVLYYLREPFASYKYDQSTAQWIETGRDDDSLWCDRIDEVADTYFVVSLENGEKRSVDIGTLTIEDWLWHGGEANHDAGERWSDGV